MLPYRLYVTSFFSQEGLPNFRGEPATKKTAEKPKRFSRRRIWITPST